MQPKMCSRIAFSYLLIFVSVNFVRSGLIASLKITGRNNYPSAELRGMSSFFIGF